MNAVDHQLYFFDQDRRKRSRRLRKPVDQLPFSLPFTGVSGALKVEAYLRQRKRNSELTAIKDGQTIGQTLEINDNEEKITDSETKQKDDVIQDLKDVNLKKNQLVSTFSDDEDEDTQRFLFEENKFAAPNLLAHLGRMLELLHERCAGRQTSRASQTWANLITSNNRNLSANTNGFNLRDLGISIPFHLQEKLKWNFEQLIASAVYSKREWQTVGYRRQCVEELDNTVMSSDVNKVGKRDSISTLKKSRMSIDDGCSESSQQNKPVATCFSKAVKRSRKSLDGQMDKIVINIESYDAEESQTDSQKVNTDDHFLKPTSKLELGKQEDVVNVGLSAGRMQTFRRELPAASPKPPRTRLEKYKYIPDKSSLGLQWRKKADHVKKKSTQDVTDADHDNDTKNREILEQHSILAHPLHPTAISFSLMSKVCEEKGWIMHESPDADLERLTVIEWARSRLQEAIKKSSEYNISCHGSRLVVKQYGETKADSGVKQNEDEISPALVNELKNVVLENAETRKPAPVVFKQYGENYVVKSNKKKRKIKRTRSGTARIELFLIVLPDDTLNLYYPSGKVAVCSVRNLVGDGKYTYVYGTDGETLLAYFTPTNAFCADKHGKLFLCTPKHGTLYNKERSVTREWIWKTSKLHPIIALELNEFLILKIITRSQINLHFSARGETYKLNVGITQDTQTILVSSAGDMMTTRDYQSEIAQKLTVVKTKAQEEPSPTAPKTKREEKKSRSNQQQRRQSNETGEMQEQRRQDLDEMFPERKNLALDLPSDVELYKLRRRIKGLAYDWMESYRYLTGISSPIKVPENTLRRKQTMSAKSLPENMPSSRSVHSRPPAWSITNTVDGPRVPSAPPTRRKDKNYTELSLEKLIKSLEGCVEPGDESRDGITPVYLTELDREKILPSRSSPKPPFRCGMTTYEQRSAALKQGCPVALRSDLLGEKFPCCRCRKREIPYISDLAYDKFIKEIVPRTQLLVISIVSSRNPSVTQCTSMLEQLYYEKNRNRSFPCAQSRSDSYRIVLYNMDSAVKIHQRPLLVARHNVIPGMFLMYIGGKLLFADHIFNGYGNARKDFLKQIAKTRKDYVQGLFLPSDFRLSPSPCRSGPRAAWGGEIGGISKSALRDSFEVDMTQSSRSLDVKLEGHRLLSAATTLSSESFELRGDGTKSAASFINLGLAIDSPVTHPFKYKICAKLLRKTAPKSRA